MHQALIFIILDEVKSQFPSEKYFVEHYLEMDWNEWTQWKKGKSLLSQEAMQKVKGLFSDYEWMLMQKVAEQTMFFPEKRHYIAQQYRRLKAMIAKRWIETPLCRVELITKTITPGIEDIVTLRVSLRYGEWGYDDILNFSMPAYMSKQIENSNKGLLEWVNKDLIHAYVDQEEQKNKEE